MLYTQIMLPVFILVGVTFAMMLTAGRGTTLTRAEPWPAGVTPLDMLFYAAVAMCLPLRRADWGMVILAWIYVVIRVLDMAGLLARADRRMAGGYIPALVLLILWVYFALEFLLAF
jgi:hypothetical protein